MPPKSSHEWPQRPITSDIGSIRYCGRLRGKATIPPERMRLLGSFVWVLVLDGKAFYASESHPPHALKRGDALLFGPDQRHAYGSEDGRPWDQIYVVFHGPVFTLLARSGAFAQDLPLWHLEPVEAWQRRVEEILNSSTGESAAANLRTVTRFAALLAEMASHHAAARKDQRDPWLDESKRLLGQPQQAGWLAASDVARIVGLSYESFRKRFRDAVGQSPHQFQQQRRVELACAAIYRGTDSFKEIADALGFCDIYHFSRTFARVMKMPPSVYRQRVRGG